MKNKNILIATVVVALIIVGTILYKTSSTEEVIGSIGTNPIENYVPAILYNEGYYSNLPITTTSTTTTSGLAVGSSGSTLSLIKTGTCNLTTGNVGPVIAATSTGYFKCSVTGVQSGDNVSIVLSNGHATAWGGFVVADSVATTSDAIGVYLLNLTGAATSSFPLATTSAQYRIFR